MKVTKERWALIKSAYVGGDMSQQECADRFNVNLKTLQSRCLREGWVAQRKVTHARLGAHVEDALRAKAGDVADMAQAVIQRAYQEGGAFLDDIQREQQRRSDGDVYTLLQLLRAWQIPTETLRKCLAPEGAQGPQVQIGVFTGGECVRNKPDVDV